MSWVDAGAGITCTWSDVELSFGDSTGTSPTYWGGGQGSCTGTVGTENLTLRGAPLDSLRIGGGRIGFSPRASRYRFDGIVSGDQMTGTMSREFLGTQGTVVVSRGQWQAARTVTP
jgi:hypothetical protein